MAHYAVSAVGADRPGIVAAVTGVFLDHGCNLEDTSMTILRGHFAMMLVVAAPETLQQPALEAALAGPASVFELVVAVRAIDDDVPTSPEGDSWTVSVYGADRPGIVHRVASLLADNGVNIVDLSTRVIGDASRPVYAMILEVTLPSSADASALQKKLAGLASDLGVECSLHPSEADIL
jgi:glycine cleavage system transcriptional repressor